MTQPEKKHTECIHHSDGIYERVSECTDAWVHGCSRRTGRREGERQSQDAGPYDAEKKEEKEDAQNQDTNTGYQP